MFQLFQYGPGFSCMLIKITKSGQQPMYEQPWKPPRLSIFATFGRRRSFRRPCRCLHLWSCCALLSFCRASSFQELGDAARLVAVFLQLLANVGFWQPLPPQLCNIVLGRLVAGSAKALLGTHDSRKGCQTCFGFPDTAAAQNEKANAWRHNRWVIHVWHVSTSAQDSRLWSCNCCRILKGSSFECQQHKLNK